MKKKKVTVTLDWEQCEMIAAYYEFPSAIFFFTKSTMKEQLKGTRRRVIFDRMEKFRVKFNELFVEAKGEIL